MSGPSLRGFSSTSLFFCRDAVGMGYQTQLSRHPCPKGQEGA